MRLLVHISYSRKTSKGGCIGDYIGDYDRGMKRDTRSLDDGSDKHVGECVSWARSGTTHVTFGVCVRMSARNSTPKTQIISEPLSKLLVSPLVSLIIVPYIAPWR